MHSITLQVLLSDKGVDYMLVHDIIKIKYVREGYLKNYPHHLISDEEMCVAFLQKVGDLNTTKFSSWEHMKNEIDNWYVGYFIDWYLDPLLSQFEEEGYMFDDDIVSVLINLLDEINKYVETLISVNRSNLDQEYQLPDWIYSYMLGRVVSPKSEIIDIHDLLVLLNADNTDDIFTGIAAYTCYQVSRLWVNKLDPTEKRPPTVFGEPHVIKSLRLQQVT